MLTSASIEWLNNAWDIATLRYAFKAARQFLENAPALKGYILDRYGAQVGVETDDQIDAFVRENVYVCSTEAVQIGFPTDRYYSQRVVRRAGIQSRLLLCPKLGHLMELLIPNSKSRAQRISELSTPPFSSVLFH